MDAITLSATGLGLAGVTAAVSASQRWVSFVLVDSQVACIPLMSGGSMHSLLLPLGLILIIVAVGLLVTSGWIRRVIAGSGVLLGAAVGWLAAGVVVDPLGATTTAINRIAGHFTGWLEVATTVTTFWPLVTLIAGVVALVFGVYVLVRPAKTRTADEKIAPAG